MTKIVVLVSGGGTNLQALLDAQRDGTLGGTIVGVISSAPNVYALERAQAAGVPTFVLPRKDYATSRAMTAAITAQCRALSADLLVLAGFLHILTEEIVLAYPNQILNVHPALIPAFSGVGCYGLHVHEKVLERGVKVTGATVHFVSAEPDEGPIILQQAVDVLPGDTPETLQKRVMEQAEWVILPRAVSLFCAGRLTVDGRKVIIKEAF